jgi:prepilin-type N-terminal cleavage/methylation domain-containing protein
LIRRREKGFTLIEVIVALAIMSIIIVAMGMTITTVVTNSRGTTERNVVLCQVQNAGYSISRDVQMADDVTLDGTSGFPLILDIPVDTDENNNYSVNYLLDGDKIIRQVYDSSDTLIREGSVAEYIDVGATTFSALSFNTYELTVKACDGETVAERSYQIKQRPGSL